MQPPRVLLLVMAGLGVVSPVPFQGEAGVEAEVGRLARLAVRHVDQVEATKPTIRVANDLGDGSRMLLTRDDPSYTGSPHASHPGQDPGHGKLRTRRANDLGDGFRMLLNRDIPPHASSPHPDPPGPGPMKLRTRRS